MHSGGNEECRGVVIRDNTGGGNDGVLVVAEEMQKLSSELLSVDHDVIIPREKNEYLTAFPQSINNEYMLEFLGFTRSKSPEGEPLEGNLSYGSGPESEPAAPSLQEESNPVELGSAGSALPSARSFARTRMEKHLS